MNKIIVNAKASEIESVLNFTKEKLKNIKISEREIEYFESIIEGSFVELCYNQTGENNKVEINIFDFFGDVSINMFCKGTLFDIAEVASGISIDDMNLGLSGEATTREIIRNSFKDIISVKSKSNVNHVKISVRKNQYKNFRNTIFALTLGIIIGFLIKLFIPEGVKNLIVTDGTKVITTLFLNAVKMLLPPLVFFSIASGVAGIGNVNTLGKVGSKVILLYCMTSFIAIGIGMGVYFLFRIGSPDLASVAAAADATGSTTSSGSGTVVSLGSTLKDTLFSIIPDNIINAFGTSNMIGIIFFAVLVGIAVTFVQKNSAHVLGFIDGGNELFSKMTTIIMRFLPISVFCSMITMVVSLEKKSLISMFQLVGVVYLGEFMMICFYGLMLGTVARVNPLKFYKKFLPVMITALAFSSSTPTIPISMECCEKKLGIDKKIYSFSIPLGATINMDGSCIAMSIITLFFAKVYGLQITPSFLIPLVFTIFILSVGAPGVTGATLICMSIIVSTFGMPSDATDLIMGVYPLLSMIFACNNVTGDAAASTIVARKEKLLNIDIYNA